MTLVFLSDESADNAYIIFYNQCVTIQNMLKGEKIWQEITVLYQKILLKESVV